MYTFLHYKGVNRSVYLRVMGKTYRLWDAIEPNFYNLGAFCRYRVKPWSAKLPVWVHEARASCYAFKATFEMWRKTRRRRV